MLNRLRGMCFGKGKVRSGRARFLGLGAGGEYALPGRQKKRRSISGRRFRNSVGRKTRLFGGFRLFQADDTIAFLPFAALFEQFDAFEAFQYVALNCGAA